MNEGIKIITRDTMNDEIDKLKAINPDIKVWSISRINNFNTCARQYHHTYVDKKEQKTGIYSYLGSAAHNDLEFLYEGKTKTLEKTNFDNDWTKAMMFGINFMSDNVRDNYKKDIDVHYNIYKKPEGKFLSEIGFILKLDDNNIMIGYIDLIQILEDNKVKIIDFKTSSLYKSSKLMEAARQLCVYQLAMEQLYNMNVISNGWEFLKYVTVQIGDYKPKTVSAREWVSKCKTQIKNLNKKEKLVDDGLIDMILSKCEIDNDIKLLPQELQDKIKIETCFVEYEVTEEVKQETVNYILETIKEIEKLDTENIDEWKCNVNTFFCSNLCSFSTKYCRYWENK